MKKEQQTPEGQQAAKSAMEHAKEQEHVYTEKNYIYLLSDSLSLLSPE